MIPGQDQNQTGLRNEKPALSDEALYTQRKKGVREITHSTEVNQIALSTPLKDGRHIYVGSLSRQRKWQWP